MKNGMNLIRFQMRDQRSPLFLVATNQEEHVCIICGVVWYNRPVYRLGGNQLGQTIVVSLPYLFSSVLYSS